MSAKDITTLFEFLLKFRLEVNPDTIQRVFGADANALWRDLYQRWGWDFITWLADLNAEQKAAFGEHLATALVEVRHD